MKYRRLTQDGDYSFGMGLQSFATDAEAVAQAVKTRLLLLYGEWWEDQSQGLPLFQNIIGTRDIGAVDLLIQDHINNTPGVESIVDYVSELDSTRKLSISCVINTKYGTTNLEVTLQ